MRVADVGRKKIPHAAAASTSTPSVPVTVNPCARAACTPARSPISRRAGLTFRAHLQSVTVDEADSYLFFVAPALIGGAVYITAVFRLCLLMTEEEIFLWRFPFRSACWKTWTVHGRSYETAKKCGRLVAWCMAPGFLVAFLVAGSWCGVIQDRNSIAPHRCP